MEWNVTFVLRTRKDYATPRNLYFPAGYTPDFLPDKGDTVTFEGQEFVVNGANFDLDRKVITYECVEVGF